ncbi:HTH_48 domain-containing protein [Trichonephila clavipes]|nr:HTH_48 domain-containing protein [Trichonephila clavipes]
MIDSLFSKFVQWLDCWKNLKQNEREGCLSEETLFALRHTKSFPAFRDVINTLSRPVLQDGLPRVEQRAYIKIAILRGRNAMECHSELVEALGNNALPYRTVERWLGKFQQGRLSTSDEQRGALNVDADGIQRLPHHCGDSSRGLH